MKNRYRIGKSLISITNDKDLESRIEQAVYEKRNAYICVSNVRTVLYANKHKDYEVVMNNSFMNVPDGMPLIWAARLWGIKEAQLTRGPRLFHAMLSNPESGIKHFLLGDTEDTLKKIEVKFKTERQSLIVGKYSPPFCDLNEYDYPQMAKIINESGADIVWISMRAPKQDFLAVNLLPYLGNRFVIGVGAAFRCSLKQQKEPNYLIQKVGLSSFFWRKVDAVFFLKFITKLCIPYIPLLVNVLMFRLLGKDYYQ